MNLRAAHRKASACSANNENWQGDPAVFIYDLLPLLALVRNSSLTITILPELGTVLRNPTAPRGHSLARVQLTTDWHGCWNFHVFPLFLCLIYKALRSFGTFVCSNKHPSEVFWDTVKIPVYWFGLFPPLVCLVSNSQWTELWFDSPSRSIFIEVVW